MDEYGFAAAAKMGMRMFETCARQSGRTMRMIERAGPNDQIMVATEAEQRRLLTLLRAAKKPDVRVFVVAHSDGPMRHLGTNPRGRTLYDHEWQRAWFEAAMKRAEDDLEAFQAATSKTWPEEMPEMVGHPTDQLIDWFRTKGSL